MTVIKAEVDCICSPVQFAGALQIEKPPNLPKTFQIKWSK